MAISFTQLINPQELTTALAIFVTAIYFFFGFITIRLKHGILGFILMVSIIVLALSILTVLPFIWFWIIVIVMAAITAIAMITRYIVEA